MYQVQMQSHSGSRICAAVDGHPSDWVTLNNPPPEAVVETLQAAQELAALVVAKGYAVPKVVSAL
jgi:predicted urease superfamily metal-dependent hydrolase